MQVSVLGMVRTVRNPTSFPDMVLGRYAPTLRATQAEAQVAQTHHATEVQADECSLTSNQIHPTVEVQVDTLFRNEVALQTGYVAAADTILGHGIRNWV